MLLFIVYWAPGTLITFSSDFTITLGFGVLVYSFPYTLARLSAQGSPT